MLPGGIGTCDELFDTLVRKQLGLHGKPMILLNVGGFYDPLLAFLERCTSEKTIRPEHASLLKVAATPEDVFPFLREEALAASKTG